MGCHQKVKDKYWKSEISENQMSNKKRGYFLKKETAGLKANPFPFTFLIIKKKKKKNCFGLL